MKRVLIVAALLYPFALPAHAETNWSAALAGTDGIVIYCKSTTRQPYAAEICEALGKTIAARFEGAALSATTAGIVYTESAAKDGEPSDPAALMKADGVGKPLAIGIHIKGTDDGNPAIYVGVRAIAPGASGDLLLDEAEVVANGPRKKLPKVLIDHMARKTEPMTNAIRSAL
ncbi:MAG: hypothetical protein H6883_07945 [Rhodobiaceae bacterium]|nr:hypothetical protein [Rhodobiaceae bacterium]MCC0056053.1 hypothetical protein [Rhodobiaceae bacterium]